MENVFSNAKALSNSILNNENYKNYIEIKKVLESNPELFNRVKEYKHLEFQNKLNEFNQNEINFDLEKHMSKLYSDLLLNNTIRDFLEKEKAFLNMFSKITNMIGEKLEIETFDID